MFGEHKFIKMHDGVEIHARILEKGHKEWLIVTHGIGEHLERHDYMAELFSNQYNILHWDLRGHGRSMGKRAHVTDFSLFMNDLKEIINYLRTDYKMDTYSLFGHSMGALITCSFLKSYLNDFSGPNKVLVNAPPVSFPGVLGKIVNALKTSYVEKVSSISYSLPLSGLFDLALLSHDPGIKEAYEADKLNSTALHTRLLFGMAQTSKKTFSGEIGFDGELCCTYGTEDHVIGVSALEGYFKKFEPSVDLFPVEGAYHEIHNEVEKYRAPYFEKLKSFFS